ILLVLLTITSVAAVTTGKRQHISEWAATNPWIMLLIAAVALTPASLMGYSIAGGYLNHFALTSYFLSVGAAAALMSLVVRFEYSRVGALARAAVIALVVLKAASILIKPGNAVRMAQRMAHPSHNPQEQIYRFIKVHP